MHLVQTVILFLAAGGAFGFLILHPLSILITDYSATHYFSVLKTFQKVFMIQHLPMAIFFTIIGTVSSLLFTIPMIQILKINDKLRKSNERLQELDELKSEFVSKVTHELRTPLSAIRGSIDIVLRGYTGQITDEQRKFLSNSSRNLERLTHLINSILDFEKLKSPHSSFNFQTVDLIPVIREVVQFQSIVAHGKGLKLMTSLPVSSLSVRADQNMIIQVLNNLINNSIKYTKKGEIHVRLFIKNEKVIRISVTDSGIGIDESDIPKLFKEFQQIGKENKGNSSGLGLAICKTIINGHGGRIGVESESGKGTTFYFTLPLTNKEIEYENEKNSSDR